MSYNYYDPAQAPMPVQPTPAETPQGLAIRRSLGGGLFLVAVIAYSITALISLYNVVFPATDLLNIAMSVLSQMGIAGTMVDMGEIYDIIGTITPYLSTFNLIGFFPVALVTLALWLVYTGARKKPLKGTAGLTILQVIAIISLVGLCFSLLLAIFMMILGVAGGGYLDSAFDTNGNATAIIAAVFIFIIAILVFQIVYYVKLTTLYNNAKALSHNERVRKKASMFVIVIAFLSVLVNIGTLITAVITFVASIFHSVSDILSLVSALCTTIYSLFLAITYIKLRSEEEPFTHRPAAPQPAMAGVPPYGAYAPQGQPYPPYQQPYGQPQAPQFQQAPYGQPQAPQFQQPYGQPQAPQFQQAPANMNANVQYTTTQIDPMQYTTTNFNAPQAPAAEAPAAEAPAPEAPVVEPAPETAPVDDPVDPQA